MGAGGGGMGLDQHRWLAIMGCKTGGIYRRFGFGVCSHLISGFTFEPRNNHLEVIGAQSGFSVSYRFLRVFLLPFRLSFLLASWLVGWVNYG